jgi:hypothetical protein
MRRRREMPDRRNQRVSSLPTVPQHSNRSSSSLEDGHQNGPKRSATLDPLPMSLNDLDTRLEYVDECPPLVESPPSRPVPMAIEPGVYEMKKESPAVSVGLDKAYDPVVYPQYHVGGGQQVSLNLGENFG